MNWSGPGLIERCEEVWGRMKYSICIFCKWHDALPFCKWFFSFLSDFLGPANLTCPNQLHWYYSDLLTELGKASSPASKIHPRGKQQPLWVKTRIPRFFSLPGRSSATSWNRAPGFDPHQTRHDSSALYISSTPCFLACANAQTVATCLNGDLHVTAPA